MISKEDILEIMKENNIDINYENTENKTLEQLGVDSVDMMMLLFGIKDKYKVELPPDKTITLEKIVEKLNK